jgi:hypothetical protein
MTPELAQAIAQLRQVRIEEGSTLNRQAPKVAAAIDRVLKEARKGTR